MPRTILVILAISLMALAMTACMGDDFYDPFEPNGYDQQGETVLRYAGERYAGAFERRAWVDIYGMATQRVRDACPASRFTAMLQTNYGYLRDAMGARDGELRIRIDGASIIGDGVGRVDGTLTLRGQAIDFGEAADSIWYHERGAWRVEIPSWTVSC